MDDYEPWLTPCDPDFDPEKCESAYALWAVKEEGEPVNCLLYTSPSPRDA